ncbi:MAG: CNNM domain-containing protein, partial [Cyanobacteria bacterium]|nr:CNNM domain-containing protein [Cyanobacteriota bacterium]
MNYFLVTSLVLALTAINAFFVASEMAISRVRRTRIDELAEAGNAAAKKVQLYLDDPNRFFSGSQLGITLAMLTIGAVGEKFFADSLADLFADMGASMGWHTEVVTYS